MVEVKGAYKHDTYEQNWLNSTHVMSNVKVFATIYGRLAMRRSAVQTQFIT